MNETHPTTLRGGVIKEPPDTPGLIVAISAYLAWRSWRAFSTSPLETP